MTENEDEVRPLFKGGADSAEFLCNIDVISVYAAMLGETRSGVG